MGLGAGVSNGGHHLGDSGPGVAAEGERMAGEEELKLRGGVGFREIECVVSEKRAFDLGEFLLGRIDLTDYIGDVLGDNRRHVGILLLLLMDEVVMRGRRVVGEGV